MSLEQTYKLRYGPRTKLKGAAFKGYTWTTPKLGCTIILVLFSVTARTHFNKIVENRSGEFSRSGTAPHEQTKNAKIKACGS